MLADVKLYECENPACLSTRSGRFQRLQSFKGFRRWPSPFGSTQPADRLCCEQEGCVSCRANPARPGTPWTTP